jgi:hypothetical protein
MAFLETEVFSAHAQSGFMPNAPQLDINADTGVIRRGAFLRVCMTGEQAALHVTAAE